MRGAAPRNSNNGNKSSNSINNTHNDNSNSSNALLLASYSQYSPHRRAAARDKQIARDRRGASGARNAGPRSRALLSKRKLGAQSRAIGRALDALYQMRVRACAVIQCGFTTRALWPENSTYRSQALRAALQLGAAMVPPRDSGARAIEIPGVRYPEVIPEATTTHARLAARLRANVISSGGRWPIPFKGIRDGNVGVGGWPRGLEVKNRLADYNIDELARLVSVSSWKPTPGHEPNSRSLTNRLRDVARRLVQLPDASDKKLGQAVLDAIDSVML